MGRVSGICGAYKTMTAGSTRFYHDIFCPATTAE